MKHLSKLIKDAKTLLNYIEEEVAVIPLMNRLTKSQEELDTANRLYHPYETMLREMLNTYSKRHNCKIEISIYPPNCHILYKQQVVLLITKIFVCDYIPFLSEVINSNNIELSYQKLLQAISHEGLDYYINKKLRDLNVK